jgi:hypothetical protein
MHPTKVAQKLRDQIHQFSGIFYPHFSKPKVKFIEQMLLGIAASEDCKLSEISRALGEPILLKKLKSACLITWPKRSWRNNSSRFCSAMRPTESRPRR